MLRRQVRQGPIRGVAADVLNQVSYLAVIALCLATIVFSATNVGRRIGVLHANPLAAFGAPRDPTAGLDPAARAESGIAPPLPLPGDPPILSKQPSTESIGIIPVPSPSDLTRPLHRGTWLPILMYHYVRDIPLASDREGWNLSVTPSSFHKQLVWLRDNGYTGLTMRDADLILAGKKAMPPRPVVLTFDDGYQDFYTTAAPILRDVGFTATNYIPTRLVDGDPRYMTWAEVEQLDAEGFEMAAHSQHHADITTTTPNQARMEVLGSKADLEGHLGHQVVDWAYPYGDVNVAAAALVREAGFWSGATTRAGSWHDPSQLLYLTRVRMGGTAELTAVINGVSQPIPALPLLPGR